MSQCIPNTCKHEHLDAGGHVSQSAESTYVLLSARCLHMFPWGIWTRLRQEVRSSCCLSWTAGSTTGLPVGLGALLEPCTWLKGDTGSTATNWRGCLVGSLDTLRRLGPLTLLSSLTGVWPEDAPSMDFLRAPRLSCRSIVSFAEVVQFTA